MPSGQYFNSNPQAAAIASNLAKVFFGDAEARAEQARMEGIALENQLRQQQIDENNTVNDARGSISRLFGNMSPADVQKNAPQFYSEFARLAGRDGFGANDGSTLIRGFAANAGADDQTIARAFVGAGNGLGTNEGVSIADRNELQRRQLAPQYYNANLDDKRMRDLDTVTVGSPGATVYQGGKVFTADPQAIKNDIATQKPGKEAAAKTYDVSPAASKALAEFMGKTYPGLAQLAPEEQASILDRASVYYQQTGNATQAATRAVSEMTQQAQEEPSVFSAFNPFASDPGTKTVFKKDAATSGFVDTPPAEVTAVANGAAQPPPATTNTDQRTAVVSGGTPGSSAENAIPFDGAGTLTPGLFYMRNGAVRQYMGGPVREPTSWKRAQ